MVMRNKIVWDQLPHRAARLKVLPFASFTPIAVVGSGCRVRDIIQYAHFPGTQLQCLSVEQTGLVHHCHAEVGGDASHIIRQLPDQPGCRYRIYIYIYAVYISIGRRGAVLGLSQFLMFKTSFVRLDTPDIRSTFQKSKKKLF